MGRDAEDKHLLSTGYYGILWRGNERVFIMCACGADKRPGFRRCCESLKELHPIGIMPEFIWVEHRVQELSQAILRYLNANLEVPNEWYEERNKHIKWLKERHG
jgi:hypothetical protein